MAIWESTGEIRIPLKGEAYLFDGGIFREDGQRVRKRTGHLGQRQRARIIMREIQSKEKANVEIRRIGN